MACDIISSLVTTIASESAFSAGGRVIDQYRASLGADTTQVLLCGEDWFCAFYGIKRKNKVSSKSLVFYLYLFILYQLS